MQDCDQTDKLEHQEFCLAVYKRVMLGTNYECINSSPGTLLANAQQTTARPNVSGAQMHG